MSTFDKNLFLGQQTTEAGSTEYTPIPINELGYQAQIEKIDARQEQIKGETATMLDVTYTIMDNDGSVEAATGLKKNSVRQTYFLDLSPNGGLDMGKGKNVQLNKLRDILGQNIQGKPWSPQMLVGQYIKVKVKHAPSEKEPGRLYTNIAEVSKL